LSEKTIFEQAVEKWGPEDRVMLLAEEAGELFAALNHWRRGRGSAEKVAEELADLSIVADQLPYVIATGGLEPEEAITPEEFRQMVAKFRAHKMKRLKMMLDVALAARRATERIMTLLHEEEDQADE
jgi:hypothetical protein